MARRPRRRILGLLFAVLGASLAAEAALRAFVPSRVWSLDPARPSDETLIWCPAPFRVDDAGAVCYRQGLDVRLVNVRGEAIEYDVRFHTNDLGLVDHRDYLAPPDGPGERRIAIVGDSFVAGVHGGAPWVEGLRERARAAGASVELYDLGVSGTSILHMERLLASVARRLRIDEILVVGISNDFTRGLWTPHDEGDRIWFVREGTSLEEAKEEPPVGRVLPADATPAQIVDAVRAWRAEADRARRPWLWRSAVMQAACKLVQRLSGARRSAEDFRRANLAALARIRAAWPDVPISFVHLPRKEEVARHAYELDPERELGDLGIPYHRALDEPGWSLDLFHRYDAHPNAAGYEHIAAYVGRVLGLPVDEPR